MPHGRAPRFANPYRAPGRWWKVGLHMHTTNSDGHRSPLAAIAAYRRLDYDAIAITDHDYVTRVPGHRGRPILIPAAEISGPPDVLYLGARETGRVRLGGRGLQATIDRINARGGIAVVAHPSWSGLADRDLLAAGGYLGVELYNHVAHDLNGRGASVETWDHLLGAGRRVWATADDDCHFGDWRGRAGTAWLRVRAPRLSVRALLAALRAGTFHSTTGPLIDAVDVRDGRIVLRSSPAVRAHLISAGAGAGGIQVANGSGTRTTWRFDVMKDRLNVTHYVRIEVQDRAGRTAWSNALYVRGKGVRFW